MSLDSSNRPSRSGSGQDLWPKWMWIAVPVLVVVVVAGLWWALLSPPEEVVPTATPTPTPRIIPVQPTVGPTEVATIDPDATETPAAVLPTLAVTFTPTEMAPVVTPSAEADVEASSSEMIVGAKAVVNAGAGLNMRSGAGTGHSRVKTLGKGTVVELVGGPQDADGYTWWQIRDEAGTTGWVAADFLDLK